MDGVQGLNADQTKFQIWVFLLSPDRRTSRSKSLPYPIASFKPRIQGLIKTSGEWVGDKRREQTNLDSFRVAIAAYCEDSLSPTHFRRYVGYHISSFKDNNVGVPIS